MSNGKMLKVMYYFIVNSFAKDFLLFCKILFF